MQPFVLDEKDISWLLFPHNLGHRTYAVKCQKKKKICKFQVNKTRSSGSTNKIGKEAFCFHCGSYLEKLPMQKCYCMAQNRLKRKPTCLMKTMLLMVPGIT